MTPEKFKQRMAEFFKEGYDKEGAHGNADDLMCKVLRELGYEEGVEIFETADKWYS